MSVKELKLTDSFGRELNIYEFSGVMCVRPLVHEIGDVIAIDRNQAHLLYLYLKERFEK